ncbi:MAG: tetratricopeptide repeat protein [Treponema sp.]|jgi:tetratricopeptide (TPR) repeat protein|nr:tetratricopeptide repeat protein [Treponema sp.]
MNVTILGRTGNPRRAGNHAEAEELLGQYLAKHQDDREARLLLGITLAEAGKPGEAADEFRSLLAKNPRDTEALNNLAVVYRRQEKYQDALDALAEAVEIDPTRAELYYNTGTIQARMGSLKAAAMSCARAVELDPGSVHACNGLGVIYLSQGLHGRAMAVFQQALRMDPENGETKKNIEITRAYQSGDEQGKDKQPEPGDPPGQESWPDLAGVWAGNRYDGGIKKTREETPESVEGRKGRNDREAVLGLMNYLKTLAASLPSKKREEFMRSETRLVMEYVINTLEGKKGLLNEIRARKISLVSSPPEKVPGEKIAGTLSYLEDLSGSMPDKNLIIVLKRRLQDVASKINAINGKRQNNVH